MIIYARLEFHCGCIVNIGKCEKIGLFAASEKFCHADHILRHKHFTILFDDHMSQALFSIQAVEDNVANLILLDEKEIQFI